MAQAAATIDPEVNGRHCERQVDASSLKAIEQAIKKLHVALEKKTAGQEWGDLSLKFVFTGGKIKSFQVLDEDSNLVKF